MSYFKLIGKVTVTVTEALVLHPLLEDRGRITESIRILVPGDRMKQKYFQIMTKRGKLIGGYMMKIGGTVSR